MEQGANDLHLVQLMPLPPHHLLLQQNPEWFILLVPAYPGCPGNKAVKHFCVCVVRDYPGEPVPEETFTHSHLSCSSVILYQLPPSITIHSILPSQYLRAWQSFCTTSNQDLFGLPLGLEPSASYSIYFFTQSMSSFCNTCPYNRNLSSEVSQKYSVDNRY